MADTGLGIDLEVLHAAITANIKQHFTSLKTVAAYLEEIDRKPLSSNKMPACVFELSELEPSPSDDPGTDQLALNARFEARLIIGFRTPKAKVEIRKLAAAFAHFLRLRQWVGQDGAKIPGGPAQVVSVLPDEFSPDLDRYEVWRVEWIQRIYIGDSVWNDDGFTPNTPLYSWSPKIGDGYAHEYRDL